MIVSSTKYDVQVVSRSSFEVKMLVVIRSLQVEDYGAYRCIAKNSLGEVESSIRLYGNNLIMYMDSKIQVLYAINQNNTNV